MWQSKAITALPAISAASGAVVSFQQPIMIDAGIALFAAIGLPIGILARVGLFIHEEKQRTHVLRDLLVSALIASANFVLVVWFASVWALSHISTLGLSVTIAFGGIAALTWARKSVQDRVEAFEGFMGGTKKRRAGDGESSRSDRLTDVEDSVPDERPSEPGPVD